MNPPGKNNWILLYKIEGARQIFVKSGTLKTATITKNNAKTTVQQFEFVLPSDAKVGSYRVSYATEGAGFVDFLFNKEDVAFSFDPTNADASITFSKSEENIIFQDYIRDISVLQQKIDSLQVSYLKNPSLNTVNLYSSELKKITLLHKIYSKKSAGKLVEHFINATNKYNKPKIATTSQEYMNAIIGHYFDRIDLNSIPLYNSAFLINRITDYVFYMNYSEDQKTQEKLYQKSIETVLKQVKNMVFKKDILEYVITQFINFKNVALVDYLFETYYDKLPKNLQNLAFKKRALSKVSVEVGRIAPEITWNENGRNYKLSTLQEAQNYLLVFWSSGCSHCLREIPLLHTFTQNKKNLKVIAFGMENDDIDWKKQISKFTGWHHALGLKKWENSTARAYQIYSTPTYIVLDKNKKIIAKPETLEGLKKIITYLE